MIGYSRKCPAETEAVGKENICTLNSKLVTIKVLTQHDIADLRFNRRNNHIIGIPACTGDMPSAILDIILYLLIFCGIVLLHPRILHTSLEVEYIVGILAEQKQILGKSLPHIIADSSLDIPVPLGIQMGIGDSIYRLFVSSHLIRAKGKHGKSDCANFFHAEFDIMIGYVT